MAPSMVSTAGRMPIKLSQGFRALWGGGSVRQIDDPWAWSCCHYFQESAGKAIFCCLKRWPQLLECFHITDLQQLNIVLLVLMDANTLTLF